MLIYDDDLVVSLFLILVPTPSSTASGPHRSKADLHTLEQ